MTDCFTFRFRVRFNECDAQQVVFNARYADYADLGVTEFFRALTADIGGLLENNLDYQVVKLTLEWRSSAAFDDVIEIRVRTKKVGNTSFVIEQEMLRAADGTELCRVEGIYVMVTSQPLGKIEIPGDIRKRLEKGVPGFVMDQSGGSL